MNDVKVFQKKYLKV